MNKASAEGEAAAQLGSEIGGLEEVFGWDRLG